MQTILKNEKVNEKIVKDLTFSVFIDSSGSTSNGIFKREIDIAEMIGADIKNISYCQWGSTAEIIDWKVGSSVRALNSGTYPLSIFQNATTKVTYEKSDGIIFMTDGEIYSRDVTLFAQELEKYDKKLIIICFLVGSPCENISVFAPLMTNTRKVIILKTDNQHNAQIKLLYSNDPNTEGKYKKSSLMYNNLVNLSNIFTKLTVSSSIIPRGSIVLRETEKTIDYIDSFEKIKDIDFDLLDLSWESLVQKGKVLGKLDTLRTIVKDLKMKEVNERKKEFEEELNKNESNREIQDLIEKITQKIRDHSEHKIMSKRLKGLLLENQESEKIIQRQLKDELDKIRGKFDPILQLIQHQESSDYTLDNFVYSSNRVNRAKTLSTNENEDDFGMNFIYDSDCPLSECLVCLEEGPIVLWFRKPNETEQKIIFNDYSLNFPLTNTNIFSDLRTINPVCGHCAKNYLIASKGKSVYREEITTFLPINITNYPEFRRILFSNFTESRILPHVFFMLFSNVDDGLKNLEKSHENYFLKQMINKLRTNDSFSEDGKKVTLFEAVQTFPILDEHLLRQPIEAVKRIFKFKTVLTERDSLNLEKRNFYNVIERFCAVAKNSIEKAQEDISYRLFECKFGLPQLRGYNPCSKEEYLKDVKDFENSNPLTPNVLRSLLYNLSTIKNNKRPLEIYNSLKLSDTLTKKELLEKIIGKYAVKNFTFENARVPRFAFYNGIKSGPSKFFMCLERVPFCYNLERDENGEHSIDYIDYEGLQKIFNNILTSRNGNAFPNETTIFVNLHRYTAEVIDSDYKDYDSWCPEMLISVMERFKKTKGQKGDMYHPLVLHYAVLLIKDFIYIRNSYSKMGLRKYKLNENASFVEKAKMEVTITNGTPVCPGILSSDTTLTDVLIKEAEEVYKNARQTEKTSLKHENNIFIKEVYKINVINPLARAEIEQEEIRRQVSQVDSIDFQKVKYIAGCDISFDKDEDTRAVASFTIYEQTVTDLAGPLINRVASISVKCSTNVPYKAGFLAFREIGPLMYLLEKTKEMFPTMVPELILLDGNGVYHPRRAGVASHFSVLSGIPCIGIAKSVLYTDGLSREVMLQKQIDGLSKEGDMIDIVTDSGETLCSAFNTTGNPKNSTYISVGSLISLVTAKEIIKQISNQYGFKVCQPIRDADLLSRRLLATKDTLLKKCNQNGSRNGNQNSHSDSDSDSDYNSD